MQISKVKFEEMEGHLRIYQERDQESRHIERDLRSKVNNFDEILDKIVRAADGYPLIPNRDVNAMQMGVSYYGDTVQQHNCTPPTEIEQLRWELASSREKVLNLANQLAAVKAIAVFAKEHKA